MGRARTPTAVLKLRGAQTADARSSRDQLHYPDHQQVFQHRRRQHGWKCNLAAAPADFFEIGATFMQDIGSTKSSPATYRN
jgi:hypothetical protein